MQIWRRAAFQFTALALAAFGWPALALDYKIAPPIVHDNLAVYLIDGGAATAPAPLTVEQAVQRRLVRIHRNENSSVTMDNMSGQSILVPFGTLLAGGLQDQVVGTATILPPNARNVPLNTFCVDPFRSSPRSSASADAFTTSGTLIPSRTAKLSMLLNSAADTKAVDRLRQSGVLVEHRHPTLAPRKTIGGEIRTVHIGKMDSGLIFREPCLDGAGGKSVKLDHEPAAGSD